MSPDHEREYVEYASARLSAVHRAAYLLTGDPHRADDLVQATMTRLYRHWRRVRAMDNIDGYVHRILTRQFLDERRLRWSRVVLAHFTPEPAAPAGFAFEDREVVRTALRRLPPGQRAVLVLRFLCDMSVEDTAAVLRCSTGNVKSQTSRGIEAMRHLLEGADRAR